MDFYMDVTPASAPSIFYSSEASAGQVPKKDKLSSGTTKFVTVDFSGLDFAAQEKNSTERLASTEKLSSALKLTDATPFNIQNNRDSMRSQRVEQRAQIKDLETNKIAQDRIKILAIKYANATISNEILARLEILNSRMVDSAPRVTREQVSFLESSINSIKAIELSRLARAKRLGLKI